MAKNCLKQKKKVSKDAGIGAVHPERMEALADAMVQKLKGHATKSSGWRTDNPLDD